MATIWNRIAHHRQAPFSAALTIALFAGITKLFSFLQQALLARQFGTSTQTDAFFVAQIVPMLVGGVFATALIMCLTRDFVLIRELDQPFGLLVIVGAVFSGLTLFWVLFWNPVLRLFGQGLDQETLSLSVSLSKPFSLMIILYSLVGTAQAFHNSRSKFLLPAIVNSFPYVGGVTGLIFFVPAYGILAVAYGLVAGLAIQTTLLLIPAFSSRSALSRVKTSIVWFMKNRFKNFAKSLILVTISLLVTQLFFITDRSISSLLGPGWVAVFAFSATAFSLPLQLIITSISNAFLPDLSALVSDGRSEDLRVRVNRLVSVVALLFLPISILVFFGSEIIVSILFKGRLFTDRAAHLTAEVLRIYSVGMLGFSLKDVASMILLALGKEKWSAAIGLGCVALNAGGSWLAVGSLGSGGVAGVTAVCLLLNAALLLAVISRSIPIRAATYLKVSGWRLGLACLAMVAAVLLSRSVVWAPGSKPGLALQSLPLIISLIIFLAVCRIVRLPEMGLLFSRLGKAKKNNIDQR